MQDTDNKLIHIGRPIDIDEMKFYAQLKALKEESKNECSDVRAMIHEIVPTYAYKENNG